MTFAEYLSRAARRKAIHNSERMGQAYYNQLSEDNPTLASMVKGKSYDPFYDDNIIGDFLEVVCERWEA